ncbi:Diaminobutyrate--2-oxoglutarate transaminase [Bienertia sinuspersici]
MAHEDWKDFYVKRHHEMGNRVVKFVEQCSTVSLEVQEYLKAIEELCSMQIGFMDVQMFLFKHELNVLLNLVALHYCINWLGVPVRSLSFL